VLDDGSIWRNVVTEAKSKVAQKLADYRGNHQYNLQDEHMRRFNAEVSQVVLWDDHEVRDNWYPTQRVDRDQRYRVKSVALLAARAKRAFFEYQPLRIDQRETERIYRNWRQDRRSRSRARHALVPGANSTNRQAALTSDSAILGAAQVQWLERSLAASKATGTDCVRHPIGLVVPDAGGAFEACGEQGRRSATRRELEVAGVLRFIRDRRIRNVVWITADVHYAAAHHYSPERARFTEFDPFWEFVAGLSMPARLVRTISIGHSVRRRGFLGIPLG